MWSRFNEGVVLGIMMQLGREEQGVLKGVIEEVSVDVYARHVVKQRD